MGGLITPLPPLLSPPLVLHPGEETHFCMRRPDPKGHPRHLYVFELQVVSYFKLGLCTIVKLFISPVKKISVRMLLWSDVE